jgi:hypothetical protein
VDRPTTRRRRNANNAHSVTVAELQARSTPAEQASVSAIQARAAAEAQVRPVPLVGPAVLGEAWTAGLPHQPAQVGQDTDTEPSGAEDGTDEQGTSNRLAMSIAVTMMAMVVFGAVTALAVLGGGRPHRLSPSTPAVQPAVISGPAVVRPDAIIKQLTTGAVDGTLSSSPDGATPGHPVGLLADRAGAAQVVSSFYGALPLRSAEAFALLAPSMQAGGWPAFDGAWRGTRSVQFRLLPRQDDEVGLRVLVSIERLDGMVLRLLQRVEVRTIPVADAPQLRIVIVQLLSAQRV